MSDQLVEFYRSIRDDQDLLRRLTDGSPDEVAAAVIAEGSRRGFALTLDTVRAALADPAAFLAEAANDELTDDELALVAAGSLNNPCPKEGRA